MDHVTDIIHVMQHPSHATDSNNDTVMTTDPVQPSRPNSTRVRQDALVSILGLIKVETLLLTKEIGEMNARNNEEICKSGNKAIHMFAGDIMFT